MAEQKETKQPVQQSNVLPVQDTDLCPPLQDEFFTTEEDLIGQSALDTLTVNAPQGQIVETPTAQKQ